MAASSIIGSLVYSLIYTRTCVSFCNTLIHTERLYTFTAGSQLPTHMWGIKFFIFTRIFLLCWPLLRWLIRVSCCIIHLFLRCFPVVSVPRDSNRQLSCHMKRFSDWYTFAVGIIHRCVCNSDSSAFCRSSCSFKARGEKREAACLNLGVGVVTSLTAALNLSKEV